MKKLDYLIKSASLKTIVYMPILLIGLSVLLTACGAAPGPSGGGGNQPAAL